MIGPTTRSQTRRDAQMGGMLPEASISQDRATTNQQNGRVEREQEMFSCGISDCDRTFNTKIGLGIHRKAKHPVEYNEMIDVRRVKSRWAEEEIQILAVEEATAPQDAELAMNQYLATKFTGRTLEAIKKRRQQQSYRDLVSQIKSEINIDNNEHHEIAEHDEWDHREPIRQEVLSILENMNKPSQSMQQLIEIANDVLIGINSNGRLTSWWTNRFEDTQMPKGPCPRRAKPSEGNRKAKRRQDYANIQNLYAKNIAAATREILGSAQNVDKAPQNDNMIGFWRNIFENDIATGNTNDTIHVENPHLHGLWQPITENDVRSSELDFGSAPGPDGVAVGMWRKMAINERRLFMNLILLSEELEPRLCEARTVFLPKKSGILTPGDYRPLSITSVVVRHLHKILARRLKGAHEYDERQRAFIDCDGTVENLSILSAVLSHARREKRIICH